MNNTSLRMANLTHELAGLPAHGGGRISNEGARPSLPKGRLRHVGEHACMLLVAFICNVLSASQ
eukprot:scaffold293138_cov40-Tisochrysis_lutea.AAC.1